MRLKLLALCLLLTTACCTDPGQTTVPPSEPVAVTDTLNPPEGRDSRIQHLAALEMCQRRVDVGLDLTVVCINECKRDDNHPFCEAVQ